MAVWVSRVVWAFDSAVILSCRDSITQEARYCLAVSRQVAPRGLSGDSRGPRQRNRSPSKHSLNLHPPPAPLWGTLIINLCTPLIIQLYIFFNKMLKNKTASGPLSVASTYIIAAFCTLQLNNSRVLMLLLYNCSLFLGTPSSSMPRARGWLAYLIGILRGNLIHFHSSLLCNPVLYSIICIWFALCTQVFVCFFVCLFEWQCVKLVHAVI